MFSQNIDVEEPCLEDDAYNDVLRIAEHLPSLYIGFYQGRQIDQDRKYITNFNQGTLLFNSKPRREFEVRITEFLD